MTHKACSPDCAAAVATKEREKRERKETRERKEKLKTRTDYLKEAQVAFNKYIRERDAKEPCISCGKSVGSFDAGHYRSVGAAPQLRFVEDNCHKQCVRCNQHLSGNQLEYRIRLVQKIGLDRVEALENNNAPRKYTPDEIKAIRDEYRLKIKTIKQSKSIETI